MADFSGTATIVPRYQSTFDELLAQTADNRIGEGTGGYASRGCVLILRMTGLTGLADADVADAKLTILITQNPDFDTGVERLTANYGTDTGSDTYTGLQALYDGSLTPPDLPSGTGNLEVDITPQVQAAADASSDDVYLCIREDPFDSTPSQGSIIVGQISYEVTLDNPPPIAAFVAAARSRKRRIR